MKKQLLFISFFSIFLSCNGKTESGTEQNETVSVPLRKLDKSNLIGFACYSSGMTSKPIETFTKLLETENYDEIKRKLSAESAAERYLATIVCKKLEKENIISLSNENLKQIEKNMIK